MSDGIDLWTAEPLRPRRHRRAFHARGQHTEILRHARAPAAEIGRSDRQLLGRETVARPAFAMALHAVLAIDALTEAQHVRARPLDVGYRKAAYRRSERCELLDRPVAPGAHGGAG